MTPAHTHLQAAVRRPRGVMLLGLLIGLALGGIGLMAMVDNWSLQTQREREQELLFVGEQYRLAIQRYYYAAPAGQTRQLPTSVKALLDDDRFTQPMHHLRRLYPDPITGSIEWGEVRLGDRLAGVFSKSEATPVKQTGFAQRYESFNDRDHYQDWVFMFKVPMRGSALPAAAAPPANPPRTVPRQH